ncbi:MAG TPA: sugar phosphate nucleotidyltransferase [Candidatus Saccharimonadales bacterium]|nr:sugar phosphate nucleotidyltransferase [Candidatus Saccharimonadales bacterium]
MNCTKAIIPVAGYGTRWLPITKAIEKCMLPVGNRPVIDYVVEDCLRAGVRDFIFVVGEEFQQLRRFYGHNQLLEEYLEDNGKKGELDEVRALRAKARFHFVVQDRYQPYGTSTPLWLSRHLIKPGEHFLYVFGDNFFYRKDGGSELTDLVNQAEAAEATVAMLVNEVPWEEVHKYGIVSTKKQNGHELYEHIVEKPERKDAPTNLNNSSSYLLHDGIFPFAEKNLEASFEGEHMFTDVLNDFVEAGNEIAVFRAKGENLDCGTMPAWHRSNQVILANE